MGNKIVRLSLISMVVVCFVTSVPVFSGQEIQSGANSSPVQYRGSDYSVVRIQDAQLAKVIARRVRIFDLGKDSYGRSSYKLAFSKKNNCFNPVVSLLDNAGVVVNNDPDLQISTSQKSGKYVLWKIGTSVVEAGSSPTSYSIVFNELSGSSCKNIEGSMFEVQVGLTDAEQDGSRKLTIRNISSKSIEITSIKNVSEGGSLDAINAEFNGVSISSITADQGISIAVGEVRDIVLKPGNICTSDEQKGEYELEMEYKINGEISTSKFEVKIDYSCDWELERIKKQRDNLQERLNSITCPQIKS